MRILFVHPNFPAQFIRPALIAGRYGHDTRFMCQNHHGSKLPKVKILKLKGDCGEEALNNLKLTGLPRTLAMADQFYRGMQSLKENGWVPDVIVSHSGFGCGLHSPHVWPDAYRISYVEWWFAENSELSKFAPNDKWWCGPKDKISIRERNLPLALELSEANSMICPTKWQRSQLPQSLQDKCTVLIDGVDNNRFKTVKVKKCDSPLLTYGTRGMEPMRGFPEFIQELPAILSKHIGLNIEIAGEDRICYGGIPPKEGSFGRWAEKILEKWIIEGRVRFVGRLEPSEYESWLKRSWIHVHLTRPFVASWSLVEAMASGCSIIASDTSPVKEFLDDTNSVLIDHRNQGWLSEPVDMLLKSKELRFELSKNAENQSKNWSEKVSLEAWSMIWGNDMSGIHNFFN